MLLHIPIFEALGLAIVPGLCLIGVGALIFSLYFIPIYLIFLREEPRVERPGIIVPAEIYQDSDYEDTELTPLSKEKIRRLIEELATMILLMNMRLLKKMS